MSHFREALSCGPVPLARLRIAVAVMLAWAVWLTDPALADQPVVHHPWGADWLAQVSSSQAALARVITLIGAVLGGLGIFPRLSFLAATTAGLIILGVPQLRGQVLHTHHLLWFSALLSASPCGDALSLRHCQAEPGCSLAWGIPVRAAWLLIALIFFFPGLHKFLTAGLSWSGDALRHLLWWKWAQSWDFTPPLRIDQHPLLLTLGGLSVLVLELGFPLAILWRPTRRLWVIGALLFHGLTHLFFNIPFAALWACYIIFLPSQATGTQTHRPWWPSALISLFLLTGVITTGVSGTTQAWPFACYPTFHTDPGPWMPTVQVTVVRPGIEERLIPNQALASSSHSQRFYATAWVMAGLYGPVSEKAQFQWLGDLAQRPSVQPLLVDAKSLRLYRARRSVDPDRPQLKRGVLLLEAPL